MANAGGEALSRSLGGSGVDWMAVAEAQVANGRQHQAVAGPRPPHRPRITRPPQSDPTGGGGDGDGRLVSKGDVGDVREAGGGDGGGHARGGGCLVLTVADLEKGEKRLPPPSSSMKMGCPKIPQVGEKGKQRGRRDNQGREGGREGG